MALGDKTTRTVKLHFDEVNGVINYAEMTFIEDDNGDLHQIGGLHRPGPVVPRVRTFDDEGEPDGWADPDITDRPQVIQDMAAALWSSERKEAYENENN